MRVAVVAHSGKSTGGGLVELRRVLEEAGVDDPLWCEVPKSRKAPKQVKRALDETAAGGLAGVRDDGDAHQRASALSRRAIAAPATRHANTTTMIAAMPIGTPPSASIGWCMPR